MSEWGIAIIGCGEQGESHARSFLKAGCEILWLCDTVINKAVQLMRTLGVEGVRITAYDALCLTDLSVDIAVIATYDTAHADQVIRALSNRKHVFCEKPLAYTLNQLRTIKHAAKEFDRWIAVNLPLRVAPGFLWLKQAIEKGEFGEIYAIQAEYLYGRLYKITEGWRSDERNYSVMLGGGIHLVDLMLWLTGQRPARVTAVGNKICTQETPFRYPDFVSATFEFPSGMIGTAVANFGCVHPHARPLAVYGTKKTFSVTNWGDVEIFNDRTYFSKPLCLLPESPLEEENPLIADFASRVSSNDPGFDSTAACIAADKALASGKKEEIEYV